MCASTLHSLKLQGIFDSLALPETLLIAIFLSYPQFFALLCLCFVVVVVFFNVL